MARRLMLLALTSCGVAVGACSPAPPEKTPEVICNVAPPPDPLEGCETVVFLSQKRANSWAHMAAAGPWLPQFAGPIELRKPGEASGLTPITGVNFKSLKVPPEAYGRLSEIRDFQNGSLLVGLHVETDNSASLVWISEAPYDVVLAAGVLEKMHSGHCPPWPPIPCEGCYVLSGEQPAQCGRGIHIVSSGDDTAPKATTLYCNDACCDWSTRVWEQD